MQLLFRINHHGGCRSGAGRKRKRSRGCAHQQRQKVTGRAPLHINFKYKFPVRNKETLKHLKGAIQNARKHGLKIRHYSFQSNHVHLIAEAASNEILTRSMRSLTITLSKRIGRGRMQLERYHLHILKTFREVKHAVQYVMFNQQKHESGTYSVVNGYSSVLFLAEGLELVRRYAKKTKITIRIEKSESWKPDELRSFIYRRGWEELLGDTGKVSPSKNLV